MTVLRRDVSSLVLALVMFAWGQTPYTALQLAIVDPGYKEIDLLREKIEAIVAQYPTYVPARIALHTLLMGKGECDEARRNMDRALDVVPKYSPLVQMRARATLCLGDSAASAADMLLAGQYSDLQQQMTLRLLDHDVAENPTVPRLYLKRARLKLKMKDWVGAEEDYTEYLKHNSVSPGIFIERARTRRQQGDFTGELADLDMVIDLSPTSLRYLRMRRKVRDELGDHVGAAEDSTSIALLKRENEMERMRRYAAELTVDSLSPKRRLGAYRGLADLAERTKSEDISGRIEDLLEQYRFLLDWTKQSRLITMYGKTLTRNDVSQEGKRKTYLRKTYLKLLELKKDQQFAHLAERIDSTLAVHKDLAPKE